MGSHGSLSVAVLYNGTFEEVNLCQKSSNEQIGKSQY